MESGKVVPKRAWDWLLVVDRAKVEKIEKAPNGSGGRTSNPSVWRKRIRRRSGWGRRKGGKATARKLTAEERKESARKAVLARWAKAQEC